MVAEIERIEVERRETLATEVAKKLLAYVLSGKIEPGQRLPSERNLAQGLGVGRSVVREALKSLTLLGLVEVRQGDGTYLKRTDSGLLPQAIEWGLLLGVKRTMDLVEARGHIEVILARLAAQRRDDDAVADLHKLLKRMEHARHPKDFVDADVAFHLRVAEAAGNGILSDILTSIRSLLRVWIARVVEEDVNFERSYEEHVPILDAIAAGDPERAAQAMSDHMAGASARLQATLGSSESLVEASSESRAAG